MKTTLAKKLFLFASATLITTFSMAQKPSPAAMVGGSVNGAAITINYSAPSVRGRAVWNSAMVPYGKVWRAGANEATVFTTDKEINVGGKTLAAGRYTLYVLVNENEWVYIFNSDSKPGKWGITRAGETTNDPATEVVRVAVKPQRSCSFNERLVYNIDDKGFALSWENMKGWVAVN